MENTKKISTIIFIFINIFFNINYASFCYSSLIMKDFSKICWIIPFLSLLPFLFLIFIYKEKDIKESIKKNILFKILMLINSVIHVTIIIYITSLILGNAFFKINFTSFFIIITIIFCIYLSTINLNILYRLGLILCFCILLFLPLIFDLEISNQPYLDILPDKLSLNIFKGLYFSIIYSDLFLYSLFNNKYDKPISKKILIISSVIIAIITTLQIIDSYTLVNYRYYEDIKILSLHRYFSHSGKRFFEHLDIILLYILLSTCFFKCPFYTITTNNTLNIKKNLFLFIFYLIVSPLIFLLLYNNKIIYLFCILGSITSFLIALLICLYSRRIKNVRKTKTRIKHI